MARKVGIEGLYYITHFGNVVSILQKGIFSHALVEKEKLSYQTIYNLDIVNRRATKIVEGEKTLWDFANLYFQPRNAMLYYLKDLKDRIAIICVKKSILKKSNIFLATGNAAHNESQIIPIGECQEIFPKIRDEIDKEWWSREDGSKRKMMAECLVPDLVPASYIQSIYVANDKGKHNLEKIISDSGDKVIQKIPVVVEPKKFFLPDFRISLTSNISLIRGDMFFSTMQTLTVSVNCVGVMGKGLASTAKYRFPDLYVRYEDLCKQGILEMGKPYLYKRESSIFYELAEEGVYLENGNNHHTWFLLFPTKKHWRNKADLPGIEKGLQWIVENSQKSGIQSLALPALGCGLGQLEWQDVGPLMCKYMAGIDIPVAIYLPGERELSGDLLSPEFLLST